MNAILGIALAWALAYAAGQETSTYTYDVHGRLIAVERSTGAQTAYAYDDADSRTAKATTGGAAPSALAAPPHPDDTPELEPQPPLPEGDEPN